MTFVLLITFVGSLIHLYSVGYMAHDPERRKFFGYLNLFVASMLLLVLADNYLLLYVGWEGVGLASYLLIGFWQYKPSAAAAAKKAFVMNRVGDFGLSVAVMLLFVTFGTVTFVGVDAAAPGAGQTTLLVLGLLLLLAACGKSAQFPLQAWLLDAMEGPTPVSALIHAATMVTAGVYLIVRSNVIFTLSPGASAAVIAVGTVTLIFGAAIGMAKDDIKKSLAGSTMSQIGYMMLGAGLGPIGYVFAIFMLIAHGVFKATLFLCAGSVIHGMNDEQNMRRYGALFASMKVTAFAFICGYVGIIAIPPFSGFFTKDKIIEAAFGYNWGIGLVASFGAAITAFYMTRMLAMTFFGDRRWRDDAHPHESPWTMTVPGAAVDPEPVPGRGPEHQRGVREVAGAGRRLRRAGAGDQSLVPLRLHARPGPRLRGARVAAVRTARGARDRPAARLPADGRGRGRTSTGTPSTRRCSCGRVSTPPGRWSSSTTGGSTAR